MGTGYSKYAGFTEQMLEEYETLTYLSRGEILNLYKKFHNLGPRELNEDFHFRFPVQEVELIFPELMYNPFRGRIYRVFSSWGDGRFSFEDLLDFCSVMSEKCPDKVKAAWAFRIYDVNEDGAVDSEDIKYVIDHLTADRSSKGRRIEEEAKDKIVKILLDEMDIQSVGSIGPMEFEHAVGKMSEFTTSFCFRT